MYKVLWIDDQHKDSEMLQFAIEADNEGLFLEGYSSFEEGFEVLERKPEYFDLILLDGLFFEKKGQVSGTEDESGIGMAIARINELKSRKVFPWFVLSGKDKFTKGENSLLKANKARCFDKTNPTDVVQLFADMKAAAREQPDAQLKYKYAHLLEVCSEQFLGTEHFARLIALIKQVESADKLVNTEDLLNPIRKIIERVFTRMAENGIIPQAIIDNKGWINGASKFLANKHQEYEHVSEIAPPLVRESIHRLVNVIQDASHGEGELRLKVDQYLKNASSDYFHRSCVYLLFDLLLWFKAFIESNPDHESNKARWKDKVNSGDWITGTVSRIANDGWGTFQPENSNFPLSILPKMVIEHTLNANDSIKVLTEPSPDGTKTFIVSIRKES
ncbi:MAG: hypothetical protein ACK5XN_17635 [Bacteroidota bacterium]|jgi:hypothetical protein